MREFTLGFYFRIMVGLQPGIAKLPGLSRNGTHVIVVGEQRRRWKSFWDY